MEEGMTQENIPNASRKPEFKNSLFGSFLSLLMFS